MKIKIFLLKFTIHSFGLLCLLLFFAARNERFAHFLSLDYHTQDIRTEYYNSIYTDLYNICRITHFREEYPIVAFVDSFQNSKVSAAQMLIVGDSYVFGRWGGQQSLPSLLSTMFQQNVCGIKKYSSLFDSLNKNVSVNDSVHNQKIIVIQSVEDRILERFYPNLDVFNSINQTQTTQPKNIKQQLSEYKTWIAQYVFMMRKRNYQYLWRNSYFSYYLYNSINNFKFKWFGIIDAGTPMYSEQPPWLFHAREVNHFYHSYSEGALDTIAKNIADLQHKLDTQYHYQMVFLPIPNKYTIYHNLVNQDNYNNFLPRLYKKLSQQQVNTVNLYQPFLNSTDTLFFRTDYHWNYNGILLTAKVLKEHLSKY